MNIITPSSKYVTFSYTSKFVQEQFKLFFNTSRGDDTIRQLVGEVLKYLVIRNCSNAPILLIFLFRFFLTYNAKLKIMKTLVQISAERQRKAEHQRQIFCEYLYYKSYMY